MARQVEARSLSDLKELADNPPQYPVNPAESPRESLTLYISRVPGSRDVILSPLRPQVKNVTGGDVVHCLYYVHLHLPADERIMSPKSAEARSPKTTIPRKPLPTTSKVSASENRSPESGPASPPGMPFALSPGPQAAFSHPSAPGTGYLSPEDDTSGPDRQVLPNPLPLNRKPLGPRAMGQAAPSAMDNYQFASSTPSATSKMALLPSLPAVTTSSLPRPSTSESVQDGAPFPIFRSPSPTKSRNHRPTFTPYSLTLIRRDPVSGEQNNVAHITSFQTNIPTPDMADPTLSPDNMPSPDPPTVNIRIETLGYRKFKQWPTRAALDKFAAEGNLNLRPGETIIDGPDRRSRATSFNIPPTFEQGFNRQVKMAYGKTWASNIKSAFHIRHKSHDQGRREADEDHYALDELAPPRAPGMQRHRRQESTGSTGSVESFGSGSGRPASSGFAGARTSGELLGASPTSPSSPIITRAGPGLKPKGYVFASPWDGRCEFRTGSRGRSLECRHVLGHSGASFETATEGRDAAGVKPVSELRYNLPGASESGSGDGHRHGKHGKHGKHGLHGKFDKLLKLDPRYRQDSSDEEEEEEDDEDLAMDLSLGRERAGGGNKGNRAKLGKLIIHDEGLKMMDLVVAANIGVWWASWEKKAMA